MKNNPFISCTLQIDKEKKERAFSEGQNTAVLKDVVYFVRGASFFNNCFSVIYFITIYLKLSYYAMDSTVVVVKYVCPAIVPL